MKHLLKLLIIVLLLSGCSENEVMDQESDLLIRVKNQSAFRYQGIMVNADGNEKNFGSLNPLNYSAYQSFDFAFRYAYVELRINGQTYTIQPFDYVGEDQLPPGKYTYAISANNSSNQYEKLNIELVED